MARLLCLSSDLAGMLYPGVELARRLAADGHAVTYASSPKAEAAVRAQGLDFVPLEESRYPDFLKADAELGRLTRMRRKAERQRQALESLGLDTLSDLLRRLQPDLLLIDGEMHEHILVAGASGVPMVLLNCFVSIWRRPGLPPPHCGARPGVGWWGSKIGIWLLWRALRLRKWRLARGQRWQRVGCDRLSLLRRLAQDLGVDLERETDRDQWLIPFTYRRLPVLSLHAFEFEFPHRPSPEVRYVGPLLLENRGEAPLDIAEQVSLESLYAARSQSQKRRRLLYAAFGSFFTADHDLLRRLLQAVARHPDWDLILSLGGRSLPGELRPLPDNVHAFDWLPQPQVLRQVDAAVTHGGINTIDECILGGVPMLIYCGGETDMAGNTARVVHHGLGLAGNGRRDSPQVIARHLERLLHEPQFVHNVRRLRSHYRAYGEEYVVEQTVEALLSEPPSRMGP